MTQVFVSYARENEDFVRRLAQDLGDAQLDVWIDFDNIQGGESWRQAIVQGITQSKAVVVCLSPDAVASEWVRREIFLASSHQKLIIPLMVVECWDQLPRYDETEGLKDVQIISVYNTDYEQALPRLLRALPGARLPGEDREADSFPYRGLTERDWELLLKRISDGKCTPFLGAGAHAGTLPLGSEIARAWADEFEYPLDDANDLARVAQYLAVQYDAVFPKEEILKDFFEDITPPDLSAPGEPHGALADLPLPIYITTNYDDFMVQALRQRGKEPRQELCQWNRYIKGPPAAEVSEPTPANPIVFHLHGHDQMPESLVLTEDDYLDFLVNISRDHQLIPARIHKALAGASLLFIGYSLADWDFRVLFRGLIMSTEASLRRINITVQLPPETPGSAAEHKQKEYLEKYFRRMDMRVYWGTAQEFAAELRQRWEAFANGT